MRQNKRNEFLSSLKIRRTDETKVKIDNYRGYTIRTSYQSGQWYGEVYNRLFVRCFVAGGKYKTFSSRINLLRDCTRFINTERGDPPRKVTGTRTGTRTKDGIKKTVAYIVHNKFYATIKEAEAAQAAYDLHELVKWSGMGSGGDWGPTMIADALVQHADKFASILNVLAMSDAEAVGEE